MAYLKKATGVIGVRMGDQDIHLEYRQPTVEETLHALALKYESSDPKKQTENILLANLELGFACIEGVGEGELIIDEGAGPEALSGATAHQGSTKEFKDALRKYFPALLVALGQHLSDVPTRIEELKKN